MSDTIKEQLRVFLISLEKDVFEYKYSTESVICQKYKINLHVSVSVDTINV